MATLPFPLTPPSFSLHRPSVDARHTYMPNKSSKYSKLVPDSTLNPKDHPQVLEDEPQSHSKTKKKASTPSRVLQLRDTNIKLQGRKEEHWKMFGMQKVGESDVPTLDILSVVCIPF
jgi:hypothetical protein